MANNTGKKWGGRAKGSQNKTTINAKNAIELCFTKLGGVDALHKWAVKNKGEFYKTIWIKILPHTIAGDKDNPLQINHTDSRLRELAGKLGGDDVQ